MLIYILIVPTILFVIYTIYEINQLHKLVHQLELNEVTRLQADILKSDKFLKGI